MQVFFQKYYYLPQFQGHREIQQFPLDSWFFNLAGVPKCSVTTNFKSCVCCGCNWLRKKSHHHPDSSSNRNSSVSFPESARRERLLVAKRSQAPFEDPPAQGCFALLNLELYQGSGSYTKAGAQLWRCWLH